MASIEGVFRLAHSVEPKRLVPDDAPSSGIPQVPPCPPPREKFDVYPGPCTPASPPRPMGFDSGVNSVIANGLRIVPLTTSGNWSICLLETCEEILAFSVC